MLDGVTLTNEIAVITLDGHRFSGPKHSHTQAQLLYAVSGTISITTEIGTWIVPPSRAVWIPAGIEHETSSFAGIRFRSLLIETTATKELPDECMVVEVTPLLRELILKLVDFAENPGSHDRTDAAIRLALSELSFQVAQPLSLPTPGHSGLARLCARIRLDPARTVSIEEATDALHMSRATFMRLFKRQTGMSFARWQQQARILTALVLLAEGGSILEVALECGYNSPSAFSAMFRRALGKPPSAYFHTMG
ncbi:AraC family transcriptional regulator [Brucella intermedia]|uniref:AraC family transcriptional regulator n=1 Tax=Brucella intermedia TaxID=94625 RepID=UPI00224A55AF|nr:helix-turn-helix transcriptional regulator [Brucella intermedia]